MPTIQELKMRDKKEARLKGLEDIVRAVNQSVVRSKINLDEELAKYKAWLIENKLEGNIFK